MNWFWRHALLVALLVSGCAPQISSEESSTLIHFQWWIQALDLFHQEYGRYPAMFTERESYRLLEPGHAEDWVIALSAHDFERQKSERSAELGNTLYIPFYSFGSTELSPHNETPNQVVDGFNNPNIVIHVDHDGDGYVTVPIHGEMTRVEASACIYSVADDVNEAVMVFDPPRKEVR